MGTVVQYIAWEGYLNFSCFAFLLVVIEEIVDDEKPTNVNGQFKQLKKKNQSSGSEDNTNSQRQIVIRGDSSVPVLESEDEDGFPISMEHKRKSNLQKPEAEQKGNKTAEKTKKKKAPNANATTNLKRKSDNIEQYDPPERWV